MDEIRTLLIIEDEIDLLNLIGELASSWQIRALLAKNIDEAAKHFASGEITAVLSDITMPGGTGIDFLLQVRRAGHNTPFMFLTGNSQRELMREALQLGATDFIDKPFSHDKLQEAVFKALEIGSRIRHIRADESTKDEIVRQEKMINLLRLSLMKKQSKEN